MSLQRVHRINSIKHTVLEYPILVYRLEYTIIIAIGNNYHYVQTLINLNIDHSLWFKKINNGIIMGVVNYNSDT